MSRITGPTFSAVTIISQRYDAQGRASGNEVDRSETPDHRSADLSGWISIDSKCFVYGSALLRPAGLTSGSDAYGPLFRQLPSGTVPARIGMDKRVCAPEVFPSPQTMAALAAACSDARQLSSPTDFSATVKQEAILPLLLLSDSPTKKLAAGDLSVDFSLSANGDADRMTTNLSYGGTMPVVVITVQSGQSDFLHEPARNRLLGG